MISMFCERLEENYMTLMLNIDHLVLKVAILIVVVVLGGNLDS